MAQIAHHLNIIRDRRVPFARDKLSDVTYAMENWLNGRRPDRDLDTTYGYLPREMRVAFRKIRQLVKDGRGRLYGDFHDENYMFRKVGNNYELVITDPLC